MSAVTIDAVVVVKFGYMREHLVRRNVLVENLSFSSVKIIAVEAIRRKDN